MDRQPSTLLRDASSGEPYDMTAQAALTRQASPLTYR